LPAFAGLFGGIGLGQRGTEEVKAQPQVEEKKEEAKPVVEEKKDVIRSGGWLLLKGLKEEQIRNFHGIV